MATELVHNMIEKYNDWKGSFSFPFLIHFNKGPNGSQSICYSLIQESIRLNKETG
ncbi:MAG: hypothetical protein GY795_30765 [Desulfobacterales bacterium]|nr:hypothetical protein [Desulfobacterales bacterium]